MDNEKSRAEFEQKFCAPPYEFSADRYVDNGAWKGQYIEYHVQCAWEGWEASRAALATVKEPSR